MSHYIDQVNMRISLTSALIFLFSCFLVPMTGFSQNDLLLGEWKALLPANHGNHVATGNGKIFYGSSSGITVLDEQDLENPLFYTTIDGLSSIIVDNLAFDPISGQLIIAYSNGIIDLFSPDEVFTILDIASNTTIQGSKKINDIHITPDGEFAYLATGFGVLQYNLQRREFGFNTLTSVEINSITTKGDLVYASADSGCYFIDLSTSANENFFGDWSLIDSVAGIENSYFSSVVEAIGESVYVAADDQVYVSSSTDSGVTFQSIYQFDDSELTAKDLIEYNGGCVLLLRHETGQSELVFFDEDNTAYFNNVGCANVSNSLAVDGNDRLWIGDKFRRMRYKTGVDESCNRIEFNGPFDSNVSEMVIENDVLYVATGGVKDNFTVEFIKDGFYEYKDQEWKVLNFLTEDAIDPSISSFYQVRPHPTEDIVYVGTYWGGMYEYDSASGEIIRLHDKDNTPDSGLNATIGDANRTRISDIVLDKQGNLWIANFGAARPLVVLTKDGNWFNFDIGANTNITNLVIDDQGFIWMVANGSSGGVVIYDIGESIEDPTDDSPPRFIRNNELPGGIALTLELDVTGDVWVGTTEGAMVFECGGSAFDPEICNANQPKFVQEGIPAFLLASERVQTIMIDGANRKWFGTRNGVFLVNANTDEQIAHFTTENSPLLDNDIFDIAYNDVSGEVYIGTGKGMMVYRSQATGANVTHSSEIYAYPNPVTPDHTGPIAIKGLARDANVKITDLNGKLVYETTALGGQAIWDGTHYDRSSKVGAGVYLVFSSTTDVFRDPDTHVTKIPLIRN